MDEIRDKVIEYYIPAAEEKLGGLCAKTAVLSGVRGIFEEQDGSKIISNEGEAILAQEQFEQGALFDNRLKELSDAHDRAGVEALVRKYVVFTNI